MGKPTHGSRRIGYIRRIFDAFIHNEEIPAGQVRPEHGGRQSGFLDPRVPLNKIANGNGDDFTPENRDFARKLTDRA